MDTLPEGLWYTISRLVPIFEKNERTQAVAWTQACRATMTQCDSRMFHMYEPRSWMCHSTSYWPHIVRLSWRRWRRDHAILPAYGDKIAPLLCHIMFKKFGVHTSALQGLLNWFVTVGNMRACQFMKNWSIDAVTLNAYFPKHDFPSIPAFPGILDVDPNLSTEFLCVVILPPLHGRDHIISAAAQFGHLEILKFLVEWWCMKVDEPGRALAKLALLRAAESGHLDVCQFVMSLGLTVKDIRCHHDEPLHKATKNGHAHILRFFRDCGLPLRAIRSSDNALLRLAAARGHVHIIKLFRDWNGPRCGLNVHDLRTCRNHALCCAAKGGHIEVMRIFRNWGRGTGLTMKDVRKSDIMRRAVMDGNIKVLHFLQEWNSDFCIADDHCMVTVQDIRKEELLWQCIIHKHQDVLKFFKAWRDPECGAPVLTESDLAKTRLTLRDIASDKTAGAKSVFRWAAEKENIPVLQVFRDWEDEYPDGTKRRLSLDTVSRVWTALTTDHNFTVSDTVNAFFHEWMRSLRESLPLVGRCALPPRSDVPAFPDHAVVIREQK